MDSIEMDYPKNPASIDGSNWIAADSITVVKSLLGFGWVRNSFAHKVQLRLEFSILNDLIRILK